MNVFHDLVIPTYGVNRLNYHLEKRKRYAYVFRIHQSTLGSMFMSSDKLHASYAVRSSNEKGCRGPSQPKVNAALFSGLQPLEPNQLRLAEYSEGKIRRAQQRI